MKRLTIALVLLLAACGEDAASSPPPTVPERTSGDLRADSVVIDGVPYRCITHSRIEGLWCERS